MLGRCKGRKAVERINNRSESERTEAMSDRERSIAILLVLFDGSESYGSFFSITRLLHIVGKYVYRLAEYIRHNDSHKVSGVKEQYEGRGFGRRKRAKNVLVRI